MTQYATPETVRADFNNVTLTNDGTRFHLTRDGEDLRVRMERILPPGPSSETPPSLDTQVSLVTGSHHMQVFWVPGGSGNTQVGFPFTWLIPEHRWVPRNSTFIRPPGFAHQAEVWNVMCSRCHATAIEPRVDSVQQRMETRAAELGISCEACHGPGERHVAARTAADRSAPKPTAAILSTEIVHPERIDPVRASEVCGFCHSMKWIDRAETWRQGGFRFRPGDELAATTPLIQPDRVEAIPGLQAYLAKNPALLDDYFWSDGMGESAAENITVLPRRLVSKEVVSLVSLAIPYTKANPTICSPKTARTIELAPSVMRTTAIRARSNGTRTTSVRLRAANVTTVTCRIRLTAS